MSAPDKFEQLSKMLERTPNDPFLLYGLGMEQKNRGEHLAAIELFTKTIAADPNYCYAYYQRGQTQELLGQPEQAAQSYRDGITASQRADDAHAQSELQAALDMLV